tara:strand:- start:198 stop:914 length:717 start_codon:yes stop_codon:yes gene_type:complete
MKRARKIISIIVLLCLLGPFYLFISGQIAVTKNWQTASHAPTQLLQSMSLDKKAVIVLMSARAFSWRGMFSTHTWISFKTKDAKHFRTYQVLGWNAYRGKPIVDISNRVPDLLWFGNQPTIEGIVVGEQATALIPKIQEAAKSYPYADKYRAWPGPNSNTFIQYIINQLPNSGLHMPYNALGQSYKNKWQWSDVSLYGLLGYTYCNHSFYITLFGLTAGVSWKPFGVIIPGVGLVSFH